MSADDMPIVNQNNLNQENCIKQEQKGDSYSQHGNHGTGHMSGGEIKDNAKVAGKIEKNNHNQSQNTNNQVTINLNQQNKSNLPKTETNTGNNQQNIKASVKQGDIEYAAEAPTVEELIKCFKSLKELFNVEVKDIEKGSIKFILKGSDQGLKNIVKLFESGELAPLLRERFNLELENAELINSDRYQKNRSQKLLAFTIAGDISQAYIDMLKAALIDTSGHHDLSNQNYSGQDLRGKDFFTGANLRGANFSRANLRNVDFSGAEIQGANFQKANLCEANFTHVSTDAASSLSEVNFSNAKIKGANFTNAHLNHANFTGVQAGLTRFWSFILYSIHIFLCLISAFTTTISITFLIYFFRASSKKPSFLSSIFIGISSVFIIVVLRTLLLNFFRPLLFPSVVLGIIAIVIVLIVAFVTTTISEEEDFSSSIMTGLLLFLILMITINSTMFADYEDSLPRGLEYFVHNLGSITTNNPNGTNGAWISMILASTIGAIFGCWFSRSAITENTQFNWLWKLYIKIATHGGTLFNEADLTDATFTSATLKGANFKNAIITRTRWRGVKSLEHARVGNSYLKYPKVRQLVIGQRLKNKNFDSLNLEGINLEALDFLSDASFVGTNLKFSTLRNSILEQANLQQAKLDGADLSHTCLTGACLQDWTIDERTILSNIKCDYILLEKFSNPHMGRRRFPPSPNNFRPGDFEKFFRKDSSVLQLLIRSEDDRRALNTAFDQLIKGNQYQFQGFEMIGDDALVKIKVPDDVDTSTVENRFYQTYQAELNEANQGDQQDTGLDEKLSLEKVIVKVFEMAANMNRTINIDSGNYIETMDGGNYVENNSG